jgi:hypothetical protein
VNLNEDPTDLLAQRIVDLEDTIGTQFGELRAEIGMAVAAIRRETAPTSFLGDLEEQLANAVSVSLSAALEAIRQSLTAVVADAVGELDRRMSEGNDVEVVAATLQHQVLLALSTFEQSISGRGAPTNGDPLDVPATARDIARINARIDDLRAMLLG